MSTKGKPLSMTPPADVPDLDAPFDEDATRPVPLQLIARLAAQDPTVQLKIGVAQLADDAFPADDEEDKDSKISK